MDIRSVAELPSVSLIQGTLSQEKADSVIRELVSKFDIKLTDLLCVPTLSVEAAQDVRQFCEVEPMGRLKLIIVFLEKSTTRAQNSLLTLLESAPDRVRFVLFSAAGVLPTVESRAHRFTLSERLEPSKQSKAAVLAVLKAVAELNDILLEDLFKNWDEEASTLLLQWAVESKLHKPITFTAQELSFDLPTGFSDILISALSASGSARGRFNTKSIMLSFVGQSKGVK